MIYLDYSATTKTSKEVLDTFVKASTDFIGNPNSLHKLGVDAHNLIDKATKQIADILKVKPDEIIYTSGSSESNNLALKGISLKYQNRGKHIITTEFEHSSIYGPIGYLEKMGFECDFVKTNADGTVDLDNLKSLLRKDTILVSICAVNSEIGIREQIEEIGKVVKENSNAFFHVDATQAIGKINIDLSNVDLASFSAHKFFGIKGIGVLIKKDKIMLEPLIPLIVSTAKALRLAYEDIDSKYNYVTELNNYLKENLSKYDNVYINSNSKCIPHILNLSIIGVKPETMLHALEKYEIYISTQTACSSEKLLSKAVYALTMDEERAKSSIRISLSDKTTKEELDETLKVFDKCYKELLLK